MSRGAARDDDPELAAGVDSGLDSFRRRADQVGDDVLGLPLPRLGQVVGDKYRVEERLGRGGMGAVFRATHLVSEKSVALKWMLRSTADQHAHRRFLREARVAGRIDHPNVVDVYDVGEDGNCGYLVMELLHGEALRARFARGSLPVSELIDLLLPAMLGVAAVHRAGVIHRDLKPDNIFLCKGPDGTPREAKVLDFGISAMTSCDPNDPTLTEDGAMLGTPAYMSPEQVQSARDIDARSDVYSFGVILYEGLTGKLPLEASSHNGLVLAIVHNQPKRLTELRPDLPPELETIVLRALAKQREDRYPNLESLIDVLLPFASQGGSLAPSVQHPIRKHWRAWALAGAGLTAIAAIVWLRSPGPERRRPAAIALSAPAPEIQHSEAVPAPQPSSTAAAQPPNRAAAETARVHSSQTEDSAPRAAAPSKKRTSTRPAARAVAATATPAKKQRSGSISVDQL
jgi:serine/threonine protein kinase